MHDPIFNLFRLYYLVLYLIKSNLWEDQFDRCLEALGHSDHDVCSEHPEYVVEEESSEEDAARDHVVEVEELHAVDGEGHAQEIVGEPVLLHDVPHADRGAEAQAHQVVGAELVIHHGLLVISLPLKSFNRMIHCFYAFDGSNYSELSMYHVPCITSIVYCKRGEQKKNT